MVDLVEQPIDERAHLHAVGGGAEQLYSVLRRPLAREAKVEWLGSIERSPPRWQCELYMY
jgi:hypothetical protein